jgi:glycosyltransferase involved in cell wall biosynthesis
MKILYVIGSLEVGGAEQHLLRISGALAARGWEPTVFVLNPGGPLTSAFQAAGVPVIGVSLPVGFIRLIRHPRVIAWSALLLQVLMLVWTHWRLRPQVAHFFLPTAYIVGGVASLLSPPLLRVMSRRSLNHYQAKHRLFTKVELWLHQKMDLVSGNSKAVIAQLREEGLPDSKLRLIYNGLDVHSFHAHRGRSEVREELGVGEKALMFVMVANLIPYKGHADLINAFGTVREQLPEDWVCICLGRDDGIRQQLVNQAKSLRIESNLRFVGSRKDVAEILGAADIGILCSHQEGFSNAVIECMAAGLAMVVTDVGGNSEAVSDNSTGFVVPPQKPSELGQALLMLALDTARRSTFGMLGKARVERMFSLSSCVDSYIDMYRSVSQFKYGHGNKST